jgi:hypothetical protein
VRGERVRAAPAEFAVSARGLGAAASAATARDAEPARRVDPQFEARGNLIADKPRESVVARPVWRVGLPDPVGATAVFYTIAQVSGVARRG